MLDYSGFICYFFQNFFELLCRLSVNAAKMRTKLDKIAEIIQRHFPARITTIVMKENFAFFCSIAL